MRLSPVPDLHKPAFVPIQRSGAKLNFLVQPKIDVFSPNGNPFRTIEKPVPASLSPASLFLQFDATLKYILIKMGIDFSDLEYKMSYNTEDGSSAFSFETRKDLPNYLKNLRLLNNVFKQIKEALHTQAKANSPHAYLLFSHLDLTPRELEIQHLERSFAATSKQETLSLLYRCLGATPPQDVDFSIQALLGLLKAKAPSEVDLQKP